MRKKLLYCSLNLGGKSKEVNVQLLELNREYCENTAKEKAAHAASALRAIEYINGSTAKYHGRCVSTLYVPKMFTEEDVCNFRNLVKVLYGIFDKVIRHYREDAAYRSLFGFPGKLEELILRSPVYKSRIPIARIDIFYNEETKDFKFCEFNTDGSSAMNEDRELNHALRLTLGYETLVKTYDVETFELFDSWAETSLRIYWETKNAKEKPYVAIVDFMESATNNEFEIFAESYRKRGIECEICEIRDLIYRDGRLCGKSGRPVDMIYRRAVTSDIISHYEEVSDFISAVKDGAVCLIGDFTTQIVHNKVLYRILHHPATSAFLSEEERTYVKRHVPYTALMTADYLPYEEIVSQKDRFILKPLDSYGSKGVFAGVEYESDAEWKEIVDSHRIEGYLVQEIVLPYQTKNIDFSKGADADFIPVSNLTGLFVYDGRFQGIYSRVSRGKIISTQYSEIALPSVVVREKEEALG